VLNNENRLAVLPELFENLRNLLPKHGVDTRDGLVQQQEFVWEEERPRELEEFGLAVREVAPELPQERGWEPHALERSSRCGALLIAVHAQHGRDTIIPIVLRKQEVLLDGEVRPQPHLLECAAQARAGAIPRREWGEVAASEPHAAAVGLEEPGDAREHGRLPGTVRPNERGDRTRLHGE
jgi:hypothetical protein